MNAQHEFDLIVDQPALAGLDMLDLPSIFCPSRHTCSHRICSDPHLPTLAMSSGCGTPSEDSDGLRPTETHRLYLDVQNDTAVDEDEMGCERN